MNYSLMHVLVLIILCVVVMPAIIGLVEFCWKRWR